MNHSGAEVRFKHQYTYQYGVQMLIQDNHRLHHRNTFAWVPHTPQTEFAQCRKKHAGGCFANPKTSGRAFLSRDQFLSRNFTRADEMSRGNHPVGYFVRNVTFWPRLVLFCFFLTPSINTLARVHFKQLLNICKRQFLYIWELTFFIFWRLIKFLRVAFDLLPG